MAKNVEEIVLAARDEASQIINRVAGELGGVGEALRKLATGAGPAGLALAGVAAAGAGIVLVGAKLADTVEQLDLLSSRSGVSIERLQVLQQQMQEAGGDSGSLAPALTFLNRAIAQGDPLLKQLGITTRDTFTAFMQLADAFAGSTDTAKKSEIAFQLLGRGAGELVALLPKMRTEFAQFDASMRENGSLIGGEVATAARDLDRQLDQLSQNWKGALTRIQAATLPWANEIIAQFNELWDAISGNKADTFGEVDAAMVRTQGRIKQLQDAIAGVHPASPVDYPALERLANLNALLDAQNAKMRELIKTRDALEGPGADARRARAQHGDDKPRTDTLAGVTVEEMAQAIAGAAFFEGVGKSPQEQVDKWIAEYYAAAKKSLKNMGKFAQKAETRDLMDVGKGWKSDLDDITDSATILDETFGRVFSALEGGFNAVFADIVAGTATVGSVLKTLWHSIVNAILGELARLAAAAVLKVVATALGIPGFGLAAKAAPVTQALAGPAGAGNVFNVYTYDARDTVRDLTSMDGRQRLGAAHVAIAGEY